MPQRGQTPPPKQRQSPSKMLLPLRLPLSPSPRWQARNRPIASAVSPTTMQLAVAIESFGPAAMISDAGAFGHV